MGHAPGEAPDAPLGGLGQASGLQGPLDGSVLGYNDPNGWKLEDNKVQITLQGTACDSFKATAGSKLFVSLRPRV